MIALPLRVEFEDSHQDDMAEWIKREYGKGEIDRAGAYLVPWWQGAIPAPPNLDEKYLIIQNWRTSHSLPLNVFQAALRSRAKRLGEDFIVAQRLKRFSSLMNKLAREPRMKLSQMHDLGGCRAILSGVPAVDKLYGMYRGEALLFEDERDLKCYDYIRDPKDDGYRGIHVVGRYSPRIESREPWNGQRIEIQIRSRLQHAFATAVETVTTFTRQPLKFGAGPIAWRRFFSLMGSALAIREGTPLVANTPQDQGDLTRELGEATKALKVRQRLKGWTDAIRTVPRQNIVGAKWLLLVLDTKANKIRVTGYPKRAEASKVIAEIEQTAQPDIDAVLVSVGSIADLRAAYPNYYADTRGFIKALDAALGVKRRWWNLGKLRA